MSQQSLTLFSGVVLLALILFLAWRFSRVGDAENHRDETNRGDRAGPSGKGGHAGHDPDRSDPREG